MHGRVDSAGPFTRRCATAAHLRCRPATPAARLHPCAEANRQQRADIAASFQRVAVAHLEERCRRAVAWTQESHPEASGRANEGPEGAAGAVLPT